MFVSNAPDGIWEVPCPECDADVGEKCTRPSGHAVEVHERRFKRAEIKGTVETELGETDGANQSNLGDF